MTISWSTLEVERVPLDRGDQESPNVFMRSSFCSGSGCVEVAYVESAGEVLIRRSGSAKFIRFDAKEWEIFAAGVKAGDFDFVNDRQ